MFNRLLLIAASSLLTLSSIAQTEVAPYKPGITAEGITYFLPQTVVRVAITATKTHHTPGEYAEYAERYLRLKEVTQSPYDSWQIDKVELYSYGEANPSNAYTIKLKTKTSAPLVELTPDGRLLTVNARVAQAEEQLPQPCVVKGETRRLNPNDFKTEEILSAGSTSKMAELTANEIYDIRENRSLLMKGQADFMPKDGEQLRLMLATLDQQEEGLMQLFKGHTTSEQQTFVFDVVPTQDVEKELLFRFSKYLGMVDADDPAGLPYYISIKDLQTLPTAMPANDKKAKEVEDLRYIVPSRVSVKVFSDTKECASASFPMAQFGRVEHLGGELFNKKYTTHVQLSPVTGGIIKIDAERPE